MKTLNGSPSREPKPADYADSYVQVAMTYTENGKEQKSDFSDMVVNSQTRKGLDPNDWLYTNSFFYEGAYQASLSRRSNLHLREPHLPHQLHRRLS